MMKSEPEIWKDNGGCLPALDAGGRKFESCFSDKGSISIVVSAFGFLPKNTSSILVWSTNNFVAQLKSTGLLNQRLKVRIFPKLQHVIVNGVISSL